jgi:hypothetical protein
MNELSNPELKKPLDRANLGLDRGAVNALVGFINNPAVTGADVPKGAQTTAESPLDRTGATILGADPATEQQPQQRPRLKGSAPRPIAPAPIAAPAAIKPITATKFAFTGRLKSGKDYLAAAIGAKIFGFADPLYFLQEYFFGNTNKDLHGARGFLQTVGQWGWGRISDKYPLTPARATFQVLIRSLGKAGAFAAADKLCVDWDSFGRNQRIWVDAALSRVAQFETANPGAKIAIVNARFEHEFLPLREAGFEHYHVMCSPKTWAKRLHAAGLSTDNPAVIDPSESLARGLDADVTKKISAQKSGAMLKAIWSDDEVGSPSARIYSTSQFLKSVSAPVPAAEEIGGSNLSIAEE